MYTTKLLVIANQTVDSEELLAALKARAERNRLEVTLVAPSTREAAGRSAKRLARAVRILEAAGIAVEGVHGDPDPMIAVADVWDPRRFDEVVVATLPGGISRWLAVDLPRRVERFTGARVTHVLARPAGGDGERERERSEHAVR